MSTYSGYNSQFISFFSDYNGISSNQSLLRQPNVIKPTSVVLESTSRLRSLTLVELERLQCNRKMRKRLQDEAPVYQSKYIQYIVRDRNVNQSAPRYLLVKTLHQKPPNGSPMRVVYSLDQSDKNNAC